MDGGNKLDGLLREAEVRKLTGLSRSQRYRMVKAGRFPAPLQVSQRAVAWAASSIQEWLSSLRPAGRRVREDDET